MPFQKGDPKPEGSGMQKGQTIHKNAIAREFLSDERCPLKRSVQILEESKELTDKERLDGWLKLIEYVASKLKAVEHSGTVDNQTGLYEKMIRELTGQA